MKRNRGETVPQYDRFLVGLTTLAAVGSLAIGWHVKGNIDEGMAQPHCVVAVGSGDSLDSLSAELQAAGDRHHVLDVVLDTSGNLVTEAQRPIPDEHGDMQVYLGDNAVFLFVGRPACAAVQGVHNAPIDLEPVARLVQPDAFMPTTRPVAVVS